MKDWRNCKKIKYSQRDEKFMEKTYTFNIPNLKPCYSCKAVRCKGKVLIHAEAKALGILGKIREEK